MLFILNICGCSLIYGVFFFLEDLNNAVIKLKSINICLRENELISQFR